MIINLWVLRFKPMCNSISNYVISGYGVNVDMQPFIVKETKYHYVVPTQKTYMKLSRQFQNVPSVLLTCPAGGALGAVRSCPRWLTPGRSCPFVAVFCDPG